MSDPKLEELFGLKSETNSKIGLMASMMKSSMDISTLSHVVSHVKEKLEDPSSQGCTEAINNLMNRIFAELTVEEIPLLIDAVEPPGGFVGPMGSNGNPFTGMNVQTFEGSFEDFIRFILGGGLGGLGGPRQ